MPIDYGTNNVTTSGNISVSGVVTATGGVFSNLTVAGSSFNSAVSGLITGIYAPLISPTFTGTPLAPTATSGTNTTQIATTAFVRTEISNLVDSSPSTLDTLNELAAALGDDPNFATTVTNNIAGKVSKSGDTMTGTLNAPTGIFSENIQINSQTASTVAGFDANKNISSLSTATYPSLTELSYVKGVTSAIQTQINAKQNTLTNPVTGTGAANHIAYWTSSSGLAHDANQLFWDPTNNRLGVGTNNPQQLIHISGATTALAGIRFDNSTGQGGTITAANSMLYFNSAFRINSSKIRLGDGASTGSIELTSAGSMSEHGNGGGLTFSDTTGRFSNGLQITGNLTVNNSGVPVGSGAANHVAYWSSNSALTHDSGQLYWDATNNRLGIGTSSPTSSLTVSGIIQLTDTAGNRVQFFRGGGTQYDYSIAKEGNHLAVSTANDGSTFRYTQFGYHSGDTWIPKTVVNNYNGYIGIGTTTPTTHLQVVGTGQFTNIDINNSAIAGTSALTVNGAISTQNQSITAGQFAMYGDGSTVLHKPNASTFAMSVSNSGYKHSFGWNNLGTHIPWTTISSSGVGIGTTTPSAQLHVFNPTSSASISEVARFGTSGVYDGNFRFMVGSTSDRGGELRYYEGSTEYSRVNFDVNRIDFMTRGAYPINFLTNNNGNEGHNQRMTITSAGLVGIGTASPAYILDVAGTGNFSAVLEGGNRVKNKTLTYFTPLDNQPPATNFATLDTRNSIAVLDFDDTTEESAVFVGVLPENAALGSGIQVIIHWMATSATNNNVNWGVQFEKMNTDLDTDSFDTATESFSATNGTSGIKTITTITCTSIDSLAAGDLFRIKIYRDASEVILDTMTGDAELIAVELRSVI